MGKNIRFTHIFSGSERTGKTYKLNEKSKLEKEDKNGLGLGSFRVIECENISDVEKFVLEPYSDKSTSLHRHLMVLGTPNEDSGNIVCKSTEDNVDDSKFKTERNLKSFAYRENEGLLFLDYDNDSEYSKFGDLDKKELLEIIYKVAPEIKNAPHLWKTSSSSNIFKTKDENGDRVYKELSGIKGQHVLVHVNDVTKIEDYAKNLFKRFWLAGYGHISISDAGTCLVRSVMDSAVNSPERLVYMRANCIENEFGKIEQSLLVETFNEGNEALDLESIEHVSNKDNVKYEKMIDEHKKNIYEKSNKLRQTFVNRNYEDLGLDKEVLDFSIINCKLFNDLTIKLWDGVEVSVKDLLANREKFDYQYCYEPFDRDYGDGQQAYIQIDKGYIYSHAHGGIFYWFVDENKRLPDELAYYLSNLSDEERYKEAGRLIIDYSYNDINKEQLYKLISKNERVNTSAVKKTIDKVIKDIEKKKAHTEREIRSAGYSNSIIPDYLRSPIDYEMPDVKITASGIVNRNSIDNFTFMLDNYGLVMRYNEIAKEVDVNFPEGFLPESDCDLRESATEVVLSHILDINDLSVERNLNKSILVAILNKYNPVLDWVKSSKWDGINRFDDFCNRFETDITVSDDYSENDKFCEYYRYTVLKSWFVQAIAALDGCLNTPLKLDKANKAESKFEFVLDLISDEQGVEKTKFIRSLLPEKLDRYIKTGALLELKNKDNVMANTKCFLCELGEVEETININSSGSIKAFLSQTTDEYRVPFGKKVDKYRRGTVFIGTSNEDGHYEDETGNRRFFPFRIKDITPLNAERKVFTEDGYKEFKPVNLQQLWAELYHYYTEGYKWWPNYGDKFDKALKLVIGGSIQSTPIELLVDEFFDFEFTDVWRKDHPELCRIVGGDSLNSGVDIKDNGMAEGEKAGVIKDNGVVIGIKTVWFTPLKAKEMCNLFSIDYSKLSATKIQNCLKKKKINYTSKRIRSFGVDNRGYSKSSKCYLVVFSEVGKKRMEATKQNLNLFNKG